MLSPKQPSTHSLKKTKKRIRKRSEKSASGKFLIRRKQDSLAVETEETTVSGKLERASTANRNSDAVSTDGSNESSKIVAKILKIKNYWGNRSMLIPNTFRITCYLEDDDKNVLEYQDLSKKEVLAQFNSRHSGSFDLEELSDKREKGSSQPRERAAPKKAKSAGRANFK